MVELTDKDFSKIVSEAIDAIPEPYSLRIENVAFIVENDPTPDQRQKLNLYPNETLFGLYEGVPLPLRNGSLKLLPDKITIFKRPLELASHDINDLKARVKHTVWHEIAHYFGLDHAKIHELERKIL